jgi:Ca2+-transporting ATPase
VVGLQVLVVHWGGGPAQAVFDTVDLTLPDWFLSGSIAASVLLLEEVRKILIRFLRPAAHLPVEGNKNNSR